MIALRLFFVGFIIILDLLQVLLCTYFDKRYPLLLQQTLYQPFYLHVKQWRVLVR